MKCVDCGTEFPQDHRQSRVCSICGINKLIQMAKDNIRAAENALVDIEREFSKVKHLVKFLEDKIK